MLVLSRQPGETIMIGDQIAVKILEVSGETIKIGIDAPRSVSIYRKELYQAIQEENKTAAQMNLDKIKSLSAVIRSGQAATESHQGEE